jgi:hypothetical protein
MKNKFTYEHNGIVYINGWYKISAIRNDGKKVIITRKRYLQLLKEGRMEGEKYE